MKDHISRRSFLRKTAITTGVASVSSAGLLGGLRPEISSGENSGREVWIAGICLNGLRAKTSELMGLEVQNILNDVLPYKPDIVCLPEAFAFENNDEKLTLSQKAEVSQKILDRFSGFSRQNGCYTLCPVYTSSGGAIYNSAVLIDRKGNRTGAYNKIHPTEGEINEGVAPGALLQPALNTEFGPVGVQICFDINWPEGWRMLMDQGVLITFWPSAYGGGITVNTKAWQNNCVIASATHKGTSKLCDMTGEVVVQTGQWNRNVYCGPVNLEKAFLATWPYVEHFRDIQQKYGRKVRITNFHEEEWSIIEILSPDVSISSILKEYGLKTYREHIASAEALQNKTRKQN